MIGAGAVGLGASDAISRLRPALPVVSTIMSRLLILRTVIMFAQTGWVWQALIRNREISHA